MTTVAEHYAHHLAPVYLWMAGGFDVALSRGETEIDAICQDEPEGLVAVDLGAGFGMHAIPLARRGYRVLAIDNSPLLIDVLRYHIGTLLLLNAFRNHAGALPIQTIEDDLLDFQAHLETKAHLILCMGDTLTHLPELQDVGQLFSRIAESLQPGGRFIATFRDYTVPLVGAARFIPVRSDDERILTCFLEYSPGHVTVHDVLHERDGAVWQMRASAYRKLRLSPQWVVGALQDRGFEVRVEPGLAGMVRIVATIA